MSDTHTAAMSTIWFETFREAVGRMFDMIGCDAVPVTDLAECLEYFHPKLIQEGIRELRAERLYKLDTSGDEPVFRRMHPLAMGTRR